MMAITGMEVMQDLQIGVAYRTLNLVLTIQFMVNESQNPWHSDYECF